MIVRASRCFDDDSSAPVPVAVVKFVRHVSLRIVPVDGVLDLRLVEWMVMVCIVAVGLSHQIMGIAFVFGQVQPMFHLQSVIAPTNHSMETLGFTSDGLRGETDCKPKR